MMQSPMFPVMLSERFECQRLKSWMRPQTSSLHLLLKLRPPSSAACLQRLLFQTTRQRWVLIIGDIGGLAIDLPHLVFGDVHL